jgi:hypothetical protein
LQSHLAPRKAGGIGAKDGVHTKMQVYRSLEERFARISSIEDAIGILQ